MMTVISAQVERYEREGFLVVPDALTAEEVAVLRQGVEKAFAAPSEEAGLYNMQAIWRPKMFEHGPEFEALVDHPGIADLVEAIIGDDCHLIANSALRTGLGQGISGWHVDDAVRFPRPADVPLDPRVPMPTFILNAHYYLCDVDEELGPTQFVPGSHRSGRSPRPEDRDENGNPAYEGRGVVSAIGKAGTCVLWNDQTWHRGGPNNSADRVRWALQTPYGRRWVSQRFYPFIHYRLPEGVFERANPRRQRLLGMHRLGAYG